MKKIYRISHHQYHVRNKKAEKRGDYSSHSPIFHVEADSIVEAKRIVKRNTGLLIKYMDFLGYVHSEKCNNLMR